MWHPEPQPIAAMRSTIDTNPRALKDVLLDDGIRKEFLGASKKTDAAVVKAFAKENQGNALKSKPKVCCFPVLSASDPSPFITSHGHKRGGCVVRTSTIFGPQRAALALWTVRGLARVREQAESYCSHLVGCEGAEYMRNTTASSDEWIHISDTATRCM